MNFTDLTPEELSAELRQGDGRFLKRRRGILGLSLFSAGIMGGIALYQTGILKRLPEPPLKLFDAGKVTGSAEAFSHLAAPDALLGMASYTITACLAGAGSQNRWKTHPAITIAMGAKMTADAVMASKLTAGEWRKYSAFCFWCLLATGATLAALPLAWAETRAAIRGQE